MLFFCALLGRCLGARNWLHSLWAVIWEMKTSSAPLVLNPQQGLPVFSIAWQPFYGILLKYSLQVSSKCGLLHSADDAQLSLSGWTQYLIECAFSNKVRFQVAPNGLLTVQKLKQEFLLSLGLYRPHSQAPHGHLDQEFLMSRRWLCDLITTILCCKIKSEMLSLGVSVWRQSDFKTHHLEKLSLNVNILNIY